MIRRFQAGDEPALYEICLRTGDSGADASARYQDPHLLGEVYVGPYLHLAPEFALVATGDDGTPAGYVLGVPDTRAFEHACERHWWPELRRRYPLDSFPDGSADARLVGQIHRPRVAGDELVAEYPAHLHIDLLPALQGRGYGRRLMTALLELLAKAGAPGVHLGVGRDNHRAIAFYRHLGFTEIGRLGGRDPLMAQLLR